MKNMDYYKKINNKNIRYQVYNKFWKNLSLTQKQLPCNVTDFVELRYKYPQFYVDKSFFIKFVLEMSSLPIKLILITRPNGWGKSINLSMLKYFLKKEVDANGSALHPQPNLNAFAGGLFAINKKQNPQKIQLQKLKIAQTRFHNSQSWIRAFQGTSPIIFLQFSKVKNINFIKMKRNLIQQILNQFNTHQYLKNTSYGTVFIMLIQELQGWLKLSDEKLQKQSINLCLKKFQKILSQFHSTDRKCYILIDDCDEPVLQILKYTGNIEQARRASTLIIDILNPIIATAKDLKIIVMGKINIFENLLISYKHFGIFQDTFSEEFGFIDEEFENFVLSPLLKSIKVETKRLSHFFIQKIAKFYGGYEGKNYCKLKIQPGSALKYLQQCINKQKILECQCYWERSNYEWMVKQLIKQGWIAKLLELNGAQPNTAQFPIQPIFTNSLQGLQPEQTNMLIYSMGIVSGVARLDGKLKISKPKVPNQSIFNIFKQQVLLYLEQQYGFGDWNSQFQIGQIQTCCHQFQQMLDQVKHQKENLNIYFLQSLFFYRYLDSLNKKYMNICQFLSPNAGTVISNTYLPIFANKTKQILIIQFGCKQISQKMGNIVSRVITNLINSTKLQKCFEVNSELGNYFEQIAIRIFVVSWGGNQQMLGLNTLFKEIVLTFKQVKHIINKKLSPKTIAKFKQQIQGWENYNTQVSTLLHRFAQQNEGQKQMNDEMPMVGLTRKYGMGVRDQQQR